MVDQPDSIQLSRSNEVGEISFRLPSDTQSYAGECLNISGSGILFRTEYQVKNGKALEVTVATKSAFVTPMIAYVEVTRCKEIRAGVFELRTEIKGIKEYS